MNTQVLSIKQMQELVKLDIDISKASMFWHPAFHRVNGILDYDRYEDIPRIKLKNNYNLKYDIPTFTLQDCINILKNVTSISSEGWKHSVILSSKTTCHWCSVEFIDDSTGISIKTEYNDIPDIMLNYFNMLKWCKQNNYI